ncbi:MAG: polyprenyl synthetase family protein [Candidatus Omnitrophica bacterium]|nr:polyprenyl synthetase family protein [Candidatus Omnitrophota bacterium]
MSSSEATLTSILKPVQSDLEDVTERLLACLENPVARMVAYLITAGGKRLRPALVLLAGRSGRHQTARRHHAMIDLATAVELIHTATLIHDDIIDEAILRRQQPTFHERFGTERAVLMGDYLYATAFSILAERQDGYVIRFLAGVCQEMSRGEFLEVESRFHSDLTEAVYLQIVREKTASLISACCHLGAHLAGAKTATVTRISEFGLNVGMAFQIMDDCLDLMGEQKRVGKTLRSDLEKGSLSLPVIYLANSLSASARDELFAPFRSKTLHGSFLSHIANATRRSGAIDQALQTAKRFVQHATDAVAERDGVALVRTYQQLARYTVERTQ